MEEDTYIVNRKHHFKKNQIKSLSIDLTNKQYVFRIDSRIPDKAKKKENGRLDKTHIKIKKTYPFSRVKKESQFKAMIEEWQEYLYLQGIIFPPVTTQEIFEARVKRKMELKKIKEIKEAANYRKKNED
jgi:hypothetical protein